MDEPSIGVTTLPTSRFAGFALCFLAIYLMGCGPQAKPQNNVAENPAISPPATGRMVEAETIYEGIVTVIRLKWKGGPVRFEFKDPRPESTLASSLNELFAKVDDYRPEEGQLEWVIQDWESDSGPIDKLWHMMITTRTDRGKSAGKSGRTFKYRPPSGIGDEFWFQKEKQVFPISDEGTEVAYATYNLYQNGARPGVNEPTSTLKLRLVCKAIEPKPASP